ncbi:MAG: right-handed parallel beta-helix repeat-containing protein [Candidatus Anstonellales archaeon]
MYLWFVLTLLIANIYANPSQCYASNLQEFIDSVNSPNCDIITITNNINVYSDVVISGISDKTIVSDGGSFTVHNGARINFTDSSNLIFRNINVKRQNTERYYHFNIINGTNITIINYTHTNFTFNSLYILGSKDITIQDIDSHFNSDAIRMNYSNNITIKNSKFSYAGNILSISYSKNIKIENTSFIKTNRYWGRGVFINNSEGVLMDNITFINTSINHLRFYNSKDILLNRIKMSDFITEGIIIERVNNITVQNSEIFNFLKRGIWISNSSVNFTNNTIWNFIRSGIFIDSRTLPSNVYVDQVNFTRYVRYRIYNCTVGGCEQG